MSVTKRQAQRCTAHHSACNCREYRYQEMEKALKVIDVWAVVEAGRLDESGKMYGNPNATVPAAEVVVLLRQIVDRAMRGLGKKE